VSIRCQLARAPGPGGGLAGAAGAAIVRRPRSVAGRLLAEDLLLLLTGDASGRLTVPSAQVDAGLGGANMVELTLMGKVDVSGGGDRGKPGRVIVRARYHLSRRQLRTPAAEIAEGNWASDAVRKVISDMTSAAAGFG
jgi:hypothetical protein